ncbi:M48 family metalloprotease [Oricola sp.]|uniref:M48 family metallopeptidase n=1 Tax=Oricola sp. TaxID=1979950 RepID=UPI0025CD980D|nr:M48 family metalloprotease [Oricola sp.]MCI5076350.1 M48 family metalloprotease [Oricola sp.]
MADRWFDRVKLRVAEAQYDRIATASERDLRPRPSASTVIAIALSLAILAVPPLIAALGVWLIFWSGFAVIAAIIGLLLLVMAWGMLPPVNRLGAEPLGRSDMPALFGLVDALADNMGAPRIDGLHIDPCYNAFIGRFGRRRRRILGIGLALWQVLEPEERVSLLAHELAHEMNGDPARLMIISGARHTLVAWIEMLVPDGRFVGLAQLDNDSAVPLARQLMLAVAWLLTLAFRAHWLLHMQLSQRAEYYADLLAAHAAGTAAERRSLAKLALRPFVRSHIVRLPGQREGAGHVLLAGLNAAVSSVPANERARLFARMEEERLSVDASHPPTVYRLRFLERHADLSGTFSDDTVDWDAIAAEIEPFLEPYGQALLDDPDLF